MLDFSRNNAIKNIFIKNRKCIINTDLDGILSGMLLQKFLGWDIVGYSSCCGKVTDELWLKNQDEVLSNCVFVDLPVCINDFFVIDQHFIAFEEDSIRGYENNFNKINPNIMRRRVFKNKFNSCEYTLKYPFGTVHFILAVLENLKLIDKSFVINFYKNFGEYDLADLVLRADRVIGNTYTYTQNCIDWANWLLNIGGQNTKTLFNIVKNEYSLRKSKELFVENKLNSFKCCGKDGDCSNMFRTRDYLSLKQYFSFLQIATEIKAPPLFETYNFGKLRGKYLDLNSNSLELIKKSSLQKNVFSFALVSSHALSLTYILTEGKNE